MNFDFVIIGGGMVGLTIAHQLIEKDISKNICLIDKENKLGAHSSGNNSGVLHAGIYYKPQSLRAKVCIKGSKKLKEWISRKNLSINNCGKLIVPQEYNLDSQIDKLYERGIKNGANVQLIDQKELNEIAPFVNSSSGRAIFSPNTSVVNPIEIIKSLENDLINKGVKIIKSQTNWKIERNKKTIKLNDESYLHFGHIINCAGLQADKIAHKFEVGNQYSILPFKGIYWEVKNNFPFKINTNVYPVPDLNMPFLGVHFTPNCDIDQPTTIGPTANLALGRENYFGIKKIEPISSLKNISLLLNQYIKNKGNFRSYFHEQAFLSIQPFLLKEAQKLIPSIKAQNIKLSKKVGIRSQVFNKEKGTLEDDFICLTEKESTHLLNVISPAFTASFAFADLVIERMKL